MTRVFIVSSNPLFGQGIENLLGQETGLAVVGREGDVDKAIERIEELKPDVIIMDSSNQPRESELAVLRILQNRLGTKIIGLDLQDNTLYIYRGEQRILGEVADLVDAIEHTPFSPQP